MSYITYPEDVKNKIALVKDYPLVTLDYNVNGTGFVLVKYKDRKYFQKCLSRDEMKMKSQDLANHIINMTESYFNGWGAKKGLPRT